MTAEPYPNLRQFFGGYFHQDWILEADGWPGLVANFVRGADRQTLLMTYDELNRLLENSSDDGDLDEALGRLGSCYKPIGTSNREWIRDVQKQLLQAVR